MSRIKIIAILIIYLFLGVWLVFYFTDCPLKFVSVPEDAAIAIRDNVSCLEKNGSLAFTQVCLDKKYRKSIYFTQEYADFKKQEFMDSLTYLLKNYDKVDIYFLAHSNTYHSWLREVDPSLRQNINLIYNTGCGNAYQHDIYLDLGAKHYISHEGQRSLSPIFYFYFLRRYSAGDPFDIATTEANQKLLQVLHLIGLEKEIDEHKGNIY